jgi:group I intron endonuclease
MNAKIYIIKNSINNKVYIGQTIQDVETRFKQHLKLLKSSKNQLIFKAIKSKGKDKFFVETIEEEIDTYKNLNSKEEFYIRKYNSLVPNGYNLCPGGQMWRRKSKIDETVQQDIIKLYLSGKSTRHIASNVNVSFKTILELLKRNGVERRSKTCRLPDRTSLIKKEELKSLYVDKNLSISKIATTLQRDRASIRKLIRKFEISRI